ncbi:MAG TPA: alkaline phosphatase D family protein [Azospirillaceae bacterium]|nr:alkaline phosphatase D family protein [Azospirillaceae bacterium]
MKNPSKPLPVVVSKPRIARAVPVDAGPILVFRGRQADRWRLSVVFILRDEAEPPDLRVDGIRLAVPPRFLSRIPERTVWRYDFAVARGAGDQRISYGFEDQIERWWLTVPASNAVPRLAYATCNGTEDVGAFATRGLVRNALWSDLLRTHRSDPFHLLMMGGDQVYADGVWASHPDLAVWRDLPSRRKRQAPFTEEMAAAADRFYADLYTGLWRQAEMAAVLASLPCVMMWDDHDIFDGYGSHPDEIREAPVYRGLYGIARRYCALMQLGTALDEQPDCIWGRDHGSFTQGFALDGLGILALDLRTERTPGRVLGEETWAAMPGWLARFEGCRHLLVMSSTPVAFPSVAWAERLLTFWPGQAELEDDLRDQWTSAHHRMEHRRLLELLFAHAGRTGTHITVVSGEVHLAHTGIMRSGGHRIVQLTSSGITHPPPPQAWANLLERLAGWTSSLPGGVAVEFPPLPGRETRFHTVRNWLSLSPTGDGGMAARWHMEGDGQSDPLAL